jgi:hypothetical protein
MNGIVRAAVISRAESSASCTQRRTQPRSDDAPSVFHASRMSACATTPVAIACNRDACVATWVSAGVSCASVRSATGMRASVSTAAATASAASVHDGSTGAGAYTAITFSLRRGGSARVNARLCSWAPGAGGLHAEGVNAEKERKNQPGGDQRSEVKPETNMKPSRGVPLVPNWYSNLRTHRPVIASRGQPIHRVSRASR